MSLGSELDQFIAKQNRLKTTMETLKGKFMRLAELSDLLILNSQETITLAESAMSKVDTSPEEATRLYDCSIKAVVESSDILEEYQRLWRDLVEPDVPWADIPGDA